jgi:hypothetical protein
MKSSESTRKGTKKRVKQSENNQQNTVILAKTTQENPKDARKVKVAYRHQKQE